MFEDELVHAQVDEVGRVPWLYTRGQPRSVRSPGLGVLTCASSSANCNVSAASLAALRNFCKSPLSVMSLRLALEGSSFLNASGLLGSGT